jgi:tetratricopeptide (TPR) repeat protein
MTEQLSLFDDKVVIINKGKDKLLKLNFKEAKEEFLRYRSIYPDSASVNYEIKIADFFINKPVSIREDMSLIQRVEVFYSLWEEFETYIEEIGYNNKSLIETLRKSYFKELTEKIEKKDLDGSLFFKEGIPVGLVCLLGGDYTTAIKLLQEALLKHPNNARAYGYLGDSYFLLGDLDLARICYREAFSIDPYEIDLKRLQDQEIHELIERVGEKNDFPLDWVPVYACLEDMFSKKEFISADDIKVVLDEYEALDRDYSKGANERVKAALFYRAMVLSENHRILRFIKRITIAGVREKMKGLDSHLFERYMAKKRDENSNGL